MHNWAKPVPAAIITSSFGRRQNPIKNVDEFHNGIDIAVPQNTPAAAIAAGRVLEAGKSPTWGYFVKYEINDGYEVFYAHLNSVAVKKGDIIEKNQTIAKTGNTGLSTGPHLHLTMSKDGVEIDPIYFFDYKLRADAKAEYIYRGATPPAGY